MNEITLFDYYFVHIAEPTEEQIERERQHDKQMNPYNDSYKPKLRDRTEIILDIKLGMTLAMLNVRKQFCK